MKLLVLDIQLFAHKKGQGSTKNGRDSIAKRLGAKAADGEYRDIAHPINSDTRARIQRIILNAYEEAMQADDGTDSAEV